MKKIIFSIFVMLAAASGTAFAAGQLIPSTGTSIGAQSFKTSNNVSIFVASLAGNSIDPGGFSAASRHGSGNRNFVVNHIQPKVYWNDDVAVTANSVGVTNSTTVTPDISGWKSL